MLKRAYEIQSFGNGGPLILLGSFENNMPELIPPILVRVGERPFTLCLFEMKNWMEDCAPWSAEIRGSVNEGRAAETLRFIETELLPELAGRGFDTDRCFIAGYSMAGLFAMWCMYASERFRACACCSGSLWYPGWEEFISSHTLRGDGRTVYLSLGGKESRSRDPLMATIGIRTQTQLERLRTDPAIKCVSYEQNPGGHFASVPERVAKGIAYMIAHTE